MHKKPFAFLTGFFSSAEQHAVPVGRSAHSQLLALEPRLIFDASAGSAVDALDHPGEPGSERVSSFLAAGTPAEATGVDAQSGQQRTTQNDVPEPAAASRQLLSSLAALDAPSVRPFSLDTAIAVDPLISTNGVQGTEDQQVLITGVQLVNSDPAELLTCTVSVQYGTLDLQNSGTHTSIAVTGAGSATLILIGTVGDLNAALGSNDLVYVGRENLCDVSGLAADSLSLTVTDSTHRTESCQVDIHLDPVDDIPLVHIDPAVTSGIAGLAETSLTISGIQISDPDANSAKVMTVTLEVDDGMLALPANSWGLTIGGNGADMLSLTGSLADINAALATITYTGDQYIHDIGGVAADTLRITVRDDISATDSPVSSVDIHLLTLPEIAHDPALTALEGTEDEPLMLAGISVEDANLDPGKILQVTLHVHSGTLTLQHTGALNSMTGNGTDVLVLTGNMDALNAALSGAIAYLGPRDAWGPGMDTLTVSVAMPGQSAPPDSKAWGINLEPVNDPPRIDPVPLVTTESDTPVVFTSSLIVITDVDNTPGQLTITIDALPTHGALYFNNAKISAGFSLAYSQIGLLKYVPDANLPYAVDTHIAFTVSDGEFTDSATVDLHVEPTNQEPAVTWTGEAAPRGPQEEDIALSGIVVHDPNPLDTLTVTLTVDRGRLSVGSETGGVSVTSKHGGKELVLVGSQADINTLLATLLFNSGPGIVGSCYLDVRVQDSSGKLNDTATPLTGKEIYVTPINHPPVYDPGQHADIAVSEGGFTVLGLEHFSVTDDDYGTTLTQLIVEITKLPQNGMLYVNGAETKVGSSFTLQDVKDGKVRYVHDGTQVRDVFAGSTADNFQFNVKDGRGGSVGADAADASGSLTTAIAISPVNQAPTVDGSLNIFEMQTNHEFSLLTNPDEATLAAMQRDHIAHIVVRDVDLDPNGTYTLKILAMPTSNGVTGWTLEAMQGGGWVTVNAGDTLTVRADAPLLFRAAHNDSDTAVPNHRFPPNLEGFRVEVTDDGGGEGVAISSIHAFDVMVYPNDHDPFEDPGASFTMHQDGGGTGGGGRIVITNNILNVMDVDNDPGNIVYTISKYLPANNGMGRLLYLSGDIDPDTLLPVWKIVQNGFSFTQQDVNDGKIAFWYFSHEGENGLSFTDTIELHVRDGSRHSWPDNYDGAIYDRDEHGNLQFDGAGKPILKPVVLEISRENFDRGSGSGTPPDTPIPAPEPELQKNTGMDGVSEGGYKTINADMLHSKLNDAPNPLHADRQLSYILTDLPTSGMLKYYTGTVSYNGSTYSYTGGVWQDLFIASSFTQQDVNDGRIAFWHDGDERFIDHFTFVLGGGEDGAAGNPADGGKPFVFTLDIAPINDDPTIEDGAVAKLNEEACITIGLEHIVIGDVDGTGTTGVDGTGKVGETVYSTPNALHITLQAPDTLNGQYPTSPVSHGVLLLWQGAGEPSAAEMNAINHCAFEDLSSLPGFASNWAMLAIGDTVSMEAVSQGLLVYKHNGAEAFSDAFHFTAHDNHGGTANDHHPVTPTSTIGTVLISIFALNDAPELVATGDGAYKPLIVKEGGSQVLNQSFGAPGTIDFALGGILHTDPDNSTEQLHYRITQRPQFGVLRNTSTGQLLGKGSTFSQADLDAGYIRYEHFGSESSYDHFSYVLSDALATLPEQMFAIHIAPENDPPTIEWQPHVEDVAEKTYPVVNSAAGISLAGLVIDDPDHDTSIDPAHRFTDRMQLTISGVVKNGGAAIGRFSFAGGTPLGVDIVQDQQGLLVVRGSLAALQQALDQLFFTTANDLNDFMTLTVAVSDLADGGTAVPADGALPAGVGAAETATFTHDLYISIFNDAPVLNVPGALSVSEDTAFLVKDGAFITTSDADAHTADNLVLDLKVAHGTLSLSGGTAGLKHVYGQGSSTLRLVGSIDALNTALENLRYKGTLDFNGKDTLHVVLCDRGNTGDVVPDFSMLPGGDTAAWYAGLPGAWERYSGNVDYKTIDLTVERVNDAPVLNINGKDSTTPDCEKTCTVDAPYDDMFYGTISFDGLGNHPLLTIGDPKDEPNTTNKIDWGNPADTTASYHDWYQVTLSARLQEGGGVFVYGGLALGSTIGLTIISTADASGTLSLPGGSPLLTSIPGGGVDGTYANTIILQGARADINAALATLQYYADFTGGSRIVDLLVTVNDCANGADISTGHAPGHALAKEHTTTLAMLVVPKNVPPEVTLPSQTVTEDASILLAGITLRDSDAFGKPERVTVTVDQGTLRLLYTKNITIISGNNTSEVIFEGSLANLNKAIANIRYTPAGDFNGTASLHVSLNDLGNTTPTDLWVDGKPTAITTTVGTFIRVTPANDAPTIVDGTSLVDFAPSPADGVEDVADPAGKTIVDLFGPSFADGIDTQCSPANPTGSLADALWGIAITGNTATAATQGTWQYFDGTQWSNISESIAASTALVLRADTLLRFLPKGDFNGRPGALTVRLIDNNTSDPTLTPPVHATVVNLDLPGATGGRSRYSDADVTLRTMITAVNDAPKLLAGKDTATTTVVEDMQESARPGSTVGSLFGPSFDDRVDAQRPHSVGGTGSIANILTGVVVTGVTAADGEWRYSTDGGLTWTAIPAGSVSDTSGLYLTASASLYFFPAPNYNTTIPVANLTVRLADSSSMSVATGDRVDVSGVNAGGTTRYSADAVTLKTRVTAVNDAPTSDTATVTLPSIDEDPASNTGHTLETLFGAHFGDSKDRQVPGGSSANIFAGIVIIGHTPDSTKGIWQYSTDSGATWRNINHACTLSSALALNGKYILLRFEPTQNYNGQPPGLQVLLLESGNGLAANTGTELDLNADGKTGGSSSISDKNAPIAVGITVRAVNDAPTVTPGKETVRFTTQREDTSTPTPVKLSDILAEAFNDTKDAQRKAGNSAGSTADALWGVAVIGDASDPLTQGYWQYSTDGGGTWTHIKTISLNNALLLAANTLVGFVPVGDFNGEPGALSLRLIDDNATTVSPPQSWGNNTRLDLSLAGTTGGRSNISSASVNLTTTVAAVNDAPTTVDATPIDWVVQEGASADAYAAGSQTVKNLFGPKFADAKDEQKANSVGNTGSSANQLAGVVITGVLASDKGVWKYSLDNGQLWTAIPNTVSDGSGLFLAATARLCFFPANAEYNTTGSIPGLTARLADDSTGALPASGSRVNVSGAFSGGTTRYSSADVTVNVAVTPVNDAPVVSGNGPVNLEAIAEDTDASSNPGQRLDALFQSRFDDSKDDQSAADGANVSSSFNGILISGYSPNAAYGVWQYSTDNGGGWSNISACSAGDALLLNDPSIRLRFQPAPDYNGAPPTLQVHLVEGGSANTFTSGVFEHLDIRVGESGATAIGGASAISGVDNTLTVAIRVNPVNDAPTASPLTVDTFVWEDSTSDAANTWLISTLFAGAFGDAKDTQYETTSNPQGSTANSLAGILITSLDSANGIWYYKTSGNSWTQITASPSTTNALYLAATDMLRFVPTGDYHNSAVSTDTPAGSPVVLVARLHESGGLALASGSTGHDLSTPHDPQGRISTGEVRLHVTVKPVNDAPLVANGHDVVTLPPIAEDAPSSYGDAKSLLDLFANSFSDAKDDGQSAPPNTFAGIVIVGNTSSAAKGQWQYWDTTDSVWKDVGTRSATNGLALLDINATKLRFNPARDFNAASPGDVPRLEVLLVETGHSLTHQNVFNISAPAATGGASHISVLDSPIRVHTTVTPVNDAPTVKPGVDTVTRHVNEDQQNAAWRVDDLFSGSFTDARDNQTGKGGGAPHTLWGVAVVADASIPGQGVWQFSLDNGVNWKNMDDGGAVSLADARLLAANALLRFTPAPGYNGQPGTLTVHLVDDNSETALPASGLRLDLSTPGATGDTSRVSDTSNTVTFAVTVRPVNDAPTITAGQGTQTLTVAEDSQSGTTTVGALFNFAFTDSADDVPGGSLPDQLAGVVITSVNNTRGIWTYWNGATWVAITSASASSGLVLRADTRLHFAPNPDYNNLAPIPGLTARLMDDSAGSIPATGQRVDVSGARSGGITRYSNADVAVQVKVDAINDAPVTNRHTVNLSSIAEDTANPSGQRLQQLFGSAFNDSTDNQSGVGGSHAANTFKGILIDGYTPDAAKGQWQYSTTNGGSWNSISACSLRSALVLNAPTILLRFVPQTDYNGTPPTLSVRLIEDGSANTFTTGARLDVRPGVSGATPTGGSAAISGPDEQIRVGITVTPVNDAPSVKPGLGTVSREVNEDHQNAAWRVGDLFGASFSDAKDDQAATGGSSPNILTGVLITGRDSTHGTWWYRTSGGSWTQLGSVSNSAALYLDADAQLRFVPEAEYNSHDPVNLTVRLCENSAPPRTAGTTYTVAGTFDPAGDHTRQAVRLAVTVRPVNDAPVIKPGESNQVNLPATAEDTAAPSGKTIGDLFRHLFDDTTDDQRAVNGSAPDRFAGMVVAGHTPDAGKGQWQYTLDGVNWYDIGSRTTANALVLLDTATTRLRFAPAADYNGTPPALTLRLLETPQGPETLPNGSSLSLTATDGTSRYANAANAVTLSTTITPVNDAPRVNGARPEDRVVVVGPIDKHNPASYPGKTLEAWFADFFNDTADQQQRPGNPGGSLSNSFAGIVIVSHTPDTVAEYGAWQYRASGGTWVDIPACSPHDALLLNDAQIILRFLPGAGYDDTNPPLLTVRVVDDSGAGGLPPGVTPHVDVTLPGRAGGIAAISDAFNELLVSVHAIYFPQEPTTPPLESQRPEPPTQHPGHIGRTDDGLKALSVEKPVVNAVRTSQHTLAQASQHAMHQLRELSTELAAQRETLFFAAMLPEAGHFTIGEVNLLKLPLNLFHHSDTAEALVYSCALADGSPLPGWLEFDPRDMCFYGTPPHDAEVQLAIVITARDTQGREAHAPVTLNMKELTLPSQNSDDTPPLAPPDPEAVPEDAQVYHDTGPAGLSAQLTAHGLARLAHEARQLLNSMQLM